MNQRRREIALSVCIIALLLFVLETTGLVVTTTKGISQSRRTTPLWLAPQQLGSFEELVSLQDHQEDRRVALHDWSSSDTVPFVTAWEHQKTLVDAHLERLSAETEASQFILPDTPDQGVDSILFLQHDPVYTLGTASDPSFIRSERNVPVVRMDRGGEVTYHGPGQLVVYPILDLRGYNQDIHWYMRALEEAVLRALDSVGLPHASRQDDVTGVWLNDKKVAAVGIKARRWITMHGLAVNVEETSLEHFQGIVPCGLEGRKVGCLNEFLDQPLSVAEFAHHMKEALEHVFRVRLVQSDKEVIL